MDTVTQKALAVAQHSAYPIASGGDGFMFAASLFAVVAISFLLIMRLLATLQQIWTDRKKAKRDALVSFRIMICLVCLSGLAARAPDAVYKIAWGEVTPTTLHTILSVKEWANTVAFWLVMGWLGIHTYFEPLWTLKLSNPLNRVWGGNLSQVKRFALVVFLSGLLAGAIAISKAFS